MPRDRWGGPQPNLCCEPSKGASWCWGPGRRKLALVTGAAGGIGEAVCARLAQQSYTLICVERDEELADKAANAAAAPAIPVACDLSDRDAVQELAERIEHEWSADLALVYLNAGIITPHASFRGKKLSGFSYENTHACSQTHRHEL